MQSCPGAHISIGSPIYVYNVFLDASRSVLNIFRPPSTGLQNAYFFHQIKHIEKLFSSSSLDKTVLSMTHLCSSLVPVAPTDSSVTFTSHFLINDHTWIGPMLFLH